MVARSGVKAAYVATSVVSRSSDDGGAGGGEAVRASRGYMHAPFLLLQWRRLARERGKAGAGDGGKRDSGEVRRRRLWMGSVSLRVFFIYRGIYKTASEKVPFTVTLL